MSRRYSHPPRHDSPHEQRLREIVDELVPDDSRKAAYLSFARELARAERRSRKPGTVPQSACVELGAVQSPFSQRTKRVVAKWFKRGLSGHLLWLVGEAVLREQTW